jgi:hypothetical protein
MRPVMSVLLRTATEVFSLYGLRVAGSVPVQLHSRSNGALVSLINQQRGGVVARLCHCGLPSLALCFLDARFDNVLLS